MNPQALFRVASALLCAAALLFAGGRASAQADAPQAPAAESAPDVEAPQPAPRKSLVSPRLSATVNAREAERRLAQAHRKRNQGVAPQPGESVRVPGGFVVNNRYWHRQERLRLEVETAQRRLNHVQRPQLARQ